MITHLDLTTEEQQHQQQPLINRTREQLQHHHHHLKATVAPHHKPSQTAASRRQGGGAMSGRGDQTRRAYLVNEDGTLTEMIDSSPTAQQGGAPDVPQWSSSESMHQVPTNGVFHLSTSGLPPSRHRQQPTYFGAAHLPSVPVAPHQLPLESAGRQRPLLDSIRTVPTAEQYAAMPYFADSDSSEDSPLSTIPQFGSDSSSLGSPDRRQSSDRSRSSARARSGPLDQYLIDKRRPAPGREASSDAACATAHVKVSAANIALSRASRSPSQRLPVECASSDDSLPSGRPFSPVFLP
ncbi:hypothetical protein DFJ77DRAFT_450463 [Powellomyces hirtus]|nr:hypothetical protein DFJ77DRAFT_450463 [Powellomyces hirtus]